MTTHIRKPGSYNASLCGEEARTGATTVCTTGTPDCPACKRLARREQSITRLQARLERAIARRKRAEERGAQACAALSDAEEAEAKARGQLAAAQVQAGLTAALKPRDAEQATATQERGK